MEKEKYIKEKNRAMSNPEAAHASLFREIHSNVDSSPPFRPRQDQEGRGTPRCAGAGAGAIANCRQGQVPPERGSERTAQHNVSQRAPRSWQINKRAKINKNGGGHMQHARPTDTAPREISAHTHTHTHTHIPPTHEKWGWGHCSSAILQYCNTAIPNSSRTLHCTVLAVVRCGAVYRSFSCVCGGAQIEPRGSRGGERREARGERREGAR